MSFTKEEIAYLYSHPLGRLATVGRDGQPDVVPVTVEFDGTFLWVGGPAEATRTRKFRNVAAGNAKVSVVVDEMESVDPFIAHGIRIYGNAEQPFEREGMVGPGIYMRITPAISWTWNMERAPVGETWYEMSRTDH
jgi:pyridoxamine 5'-phosphate oxidase family protein